MENWREKLIISADDFGLNAKANDSILKLARLQKLDRVSVLINGHFVPDEIKALKNSGVALDIHLETPESFQKSRSNLYRLVYFLLHYFSNKNVANKVEMEWEEQIEKFKQLFQKYPDGLNSHEHTHFFPSYFRLSLKLCQKFGINYIRFGNDNNFPEHLSFVSLAIYFLHKIDYSLFKKTRLISSDRLISFDWLKNYEDFFKKLPSGKTELILHSERDFETAAILKYF